MNSFINIFHLQILKKKKFNNELQNIYKKRIAEMLIYSPDFPFDEMITSLEEFKHYLHLYMQEDDDDDDDDEEDGDDNEDAPLKPQQ